MRSARKTPLRRFPSADGGIGFFRSAPHRAEAYVTLVIPFGSPQNAAINRAFLQLR